MKQKNNLLTGIKLATELKPSKLGLRKFLTVFGYDYDENNRYKSLSKVLKEDLDEIVYFELRCYEIPVEYYTNKWDVSDDILVNDILIDDIKGISLLEEELNKYLEDIKMLQPSWNCDNLI